MFEKVYDSENKKFCLYITISCKGRKKFRVVVNDYKKPNSRYSDREIIVEGSRTVHVNFPVSPKTLALGIMDLDNPKEKDFDVTLMEGPLKTYNIYMSPETKRFVKMAIHFSQVSGFEQGTPNGRKFSDGEFNIRYYDVIRDLKSGTPINTPARIGHDSGIIDVSKVKFDKYTIPMRLVILLHEFSHVYRNPKIELEIENEFGADVNALYIYLGLGFSKIDAICVFANVFLKAQTPGNKERMRKIMNYINKFENQEFAQRN